MASQDKGQPDWIFQLIKIFQYGWLKWGIRELLVFLLAQFVLQTRVFVNEIQSYLA